MSQVKLQDTKGDDWDNMSEVYKKFTQVPSATAIKVLLERTNDTVPFSQACSILDNGCGPGSIMSSLVRNYGLSIPESCTLACADFSDGMIKQVQKVKASETEQGNALWSRVDTFTSNAMDMAGVASASKSHVLAGWVYFMTPDPQRCLAESKRMLKDGGILACSAWEGSEWLDISRQIVTVRPDKSFPTLPAEWSNVDLIKGELEKAGFKNVHSERVPVQMVYETRKEFIDCTVDKMPHMIAMTRDMSAQEIETLKEIMDAKCRAIDPNEPGTMSGTALVAWGQK